MSILTVVSASMREETLRRTGEKIWRQAPRVSHGLGFIDHGRHKEAKLRWDRARDN